MMDKTSHYRDLSSPYKRICSLSNTHLSSVISHDQTPAPLRPVLPRAARDWYQSIGFRPRSARRPSVHLFQCLRAHFFTINPNADRPWRWESGDLLTRTVERITSTKAIECKWGFILLLCNWLLTGDSMERRTRCVVTRLFPWHTRFRRDINLLKSSLCTATTQLLYPLRHQYRPAAARRPFTATDAE